MIQYDFHFPYGIDVPELERQLEALEALLEVAYNHPEYDVRMLGETTEPLREVIFEMLQQYKQTAT